MNWRSNLLQSLYKEQIRKYIKYKKEDLASILDSMKQYWNAGRKVCKKYLAVSIHGSEISKICFLEKVDYTKSQRTLQ